MSATPWSITTSPTHRYLSTHCWMLLFSDTAFVLTLGLWRSREGCLLAWMSEGKRGWEGAEAVSEDSRQPGGALDAREEGRDCEMSVMRREMVGK